MRTKFTIVAIVITCLTTTLVLLFTLAVWWSWAGVIAWFGGAALVLMGYVKALRPWHSRWGATDDEVARSMPGDGIIPMAASTTRALTIDRAPHDVWPWVVQIGYGRAGWYSYDWIDNDGKPSADRIVPALQQLAPGDTIEMLPGFGPRVVEVVPGRYFVAGDAEMGTWCFAIHPTEEGSRLISRWRVDWTPRGVGARFFTLFADPGAFIMERKMLRGIKRRVEATQHAAVPAPQRDSKEVA